MVSGALKTVVMMGDEFIREKVSETSSEDISTYHWKIIKWVYVTHQASAAGQAKVKGGIGAGRLDDEGSELSQTVTLLSTPKLNLDWFWSLA